MKTAFMYALIIPSAVLVLFLSYELQKSKEEIESLNNTVEQVVQMHNEKNHELNVIKDDMFWIRHVNGELLEKCDPSTVNKVIKKTPLPKMKG